MTAQEFVDEVNGWSGQMASAQADALFATKTDRQIIGLLFSEAQEQFARVVSIASDYLDLSTNMPATSPASRPEASPTSPALPVSPRSRPGPRV